MSGFAFCSLQFSKMDLHSDFCLVYVKLIVWDSVELSVVIAYPGVWKLFGSWPQFA